MLARVEPAVCPLRLGFTNSVSAEAAASLLEVALNIPLRALSCAWCGRYHVDLYIVLSPRDLTLLREIALGKSLTQIAREMCRSRSGLFNGMADLYSRAGATNKTHLTVAALELGLLSLQEHRMTNASQVADNPNGLRSVQPVSAKHLHNLGSQVALLALEKLQKALQEPAPRDALGIQYLETLARVSASGIGAMDESEG